VVVPDKQLSLAIGKEGQNARLAAKLTGWRIDIKSATEAAEEALRKAFEEEPVREATTGSRDILAIAEEILKEKEGAALSDGELLALSQAIQVVDQAETALEMEQAAIELEAETEEAELTAEAEEVLEGAEADDLVARAEALLTGKDEAPVEAEIEADAALTEELPAAEEAEAEPVVEVTAAEVTEAEPVVAKEAEAPEAIAEEVEAVTDVSEEPVEAEVALEAEPKPAPESELGIPIQWVEEGEEDDELEETGRGKGKKKGRRRKRQLVYDEDLGEVVARRRRKPGRQRDKWEDYID
jgi:N utilization substance protein A